MDNMDFSQWNKATGELDWGAQNAIHTALSLAAEGKSSIVYGSDYSGDGGACLVNTVGQMLAVGGGSGIPSRHFGAMVSQFDVLNRQFSERGVNTDPRRMSPLAAEILLQNFGGLKPPPPNNDKPNVVVHGVITGRISGEIIPEVTDETLANEWLAALSTDAIPEDEITEVVDPVKEFDYAEGPDYKGYGLAYNDLD